MKKARIFILLFVLLFMGITGWYFTSIAQGFEEDCYCATPICSGTCNVLCKCIPIATSLANNSGGQGPYRSSETGHCGTCLAKLWPHVPCWSNCGPAKAVYDPTYCGDN